MARMARRAETTGSEHWLRLAIAEHAQAFDGALRAAFHFETDEGIEWLSPIESDAFAEYRDDVFLKRLRVDSLKVALSDFWPARGPQWDGLGRTSRGRLLLIEAKAHLGEVEDGTTRASDANAKALIFRSLLQAQSYFEATAGKPWTDTYYQYVNRLTHLYFLHKINGLDAYLVFVNFADAPDRARPAGVSEWRDHGRAVRQMLGLPVQPMSRVCEMIWSVPDMLADKAPMIKSGAA